MHAHVTLSMKIVVKMERGKHRWDCNNNIKLAAQECSLQRVGKCFTCFSLQACSTNFWDGRIYTGTYRYLIDLLAINVAVARCEPSLILVLFVYHCRCVSRSCSQGCPKYQLWRFVRETRSYHVRICTPFWFYFHVHCLLSIAKSLRNYPFSNFLVFHLQVQIQVPHSLLLLTCHPKVNCLFAFFYCSLGTN